MDFLKRRAWFTACAILLSGAMAAQTADSPITLSEAMARARAHHPALTAGDAALKAQTGRIAEAGLPTQSSVELLVEDVGGTGEREGFSVAQTTLSLSHVMELGGKREARVTVAETERAVIEAEQDALRLDVGAEVARRFIDTLHAQADLALASETVQVAARTLAAVDKRARNAQALPAEAARARVGLEQAKLDAEDAEHGLRSARHSLAAAMGERQVAFGRAEGALFEFAPSVPFEVVEGRIEASPQFLRFASETRVRDAQIRLAEIRRRPDVRTQIGVRQYGDGDDVALMAGVSMPLGSRRRAGPSVDIARAERSRIEAEQQTAFLKVRAQLFEQYQKLEHARHESSILRDTMIPQLEGALEKSEYAYQRGRYSYLEWTEVQRELFAARRRLNEVAANFHTLRIEIERLSGERVAFSGESR